MIIGMRGHDFGRMEPEALAAAIRETGFRATQLAFTKAFPQPAAQYMTPEALRAIREAFAAEGVALPVMGCYVSASDRDPEKLAAGEAAYARLLGFVRSAVAAAEACGALVAIEPVAVHTLNTPELTQRLIADVNHPRLRIILDVANLVTPQTAAPGAQQELLERCLACFGERIAVLHVKDGVFNAEGQWENRPLGQGVMDWARLLPRLRAHNDSLCALREGVFPGMAEEECRIMRRWAQD